MKILVIGAGSIGKRHIKNLLKINIKPENIFVVETRKDRIIEVNKIGVKNTYKNLNDALKKNSFFLGLVCSPTSLHMAQCIKLAKNKIHLLFINFYQQIYKELID